MRFSRLKRNGARISGEKLAKERRLRDKLKRIGKNIILSLYIKSVLKIYKEKGKRELKNKNFLKESEK